VKDYGTGRLPAKATLQQGRYVILHTVGKGGMGAVYLALDTQRADRSVAIKEMSQARLLNEEELQRARQRFQQEAAMLRALNHPNLPQVHDSFEERDRLYLVMDYIDGTTLSDLLKQAPGSRLVVPQVVEFALQLCSVLHYLHCQQPPMAEDQPEVFGDPDRLQQSFSGDARGQTLQVAHFLPVAFADPNLLAGDFDDFLSVVHRAPPVATGP